MAGPAAILIDNSMHDLFLVLVLLMAIKADRVALIHQQAGRIGSMGVVTDRAFATLQCGMHAGLFVQVEIFLFMAHEAELVAFFNQQQLADNAMRQVTILAFAILNTGVFILHSAILIQKIAMAIGTFLFLELTCCITVLWTG